MGKRSKRKKECWKTRRMEIQRDGKEEGCEGEEKIGV